MGRAILLQGMCHWPDVQEVPVACGVALSQIIAGRSPLLQPGAVQARIFVARKVL